MKGVEKTEKKKKVSEKDLGRIYSFYTRVLYTYVFYIILSKAKITLFSASGECARNFCQNTDRIIYVLRR